MSIDGNRFILWYDSDQERLRLQSKTEIVIGKRANDAAMDAAMETLNVLLST